MHTIELDVNVSDIELKALNKPATATQVASELMYLIQAYMNEAYPGVDFEVIVHDNFTDPIN